MFKYKTVFSVLVTFFFDNQSELGHGENSNPDDSGPRKQKR